MSARIETLIRVELSPGVDEFWTLDGKLAGRSPAAEPVHKSGYVLPRRGDRVTVTKQPSGLVDCVDLYKDLELEVRDLVIISPGTEQQSDYGVVVAVGSKEYTLPVECVAKVGGAA